MEQIKTVQKLIDSYRKLPGIGYKTAERLAYATLSLTNEEREAFILALQDVSSKVHHCENCGTFYDDFCPICNDTTRDKHQLLVVSNSKDIFSIEKAGGYNGGYFSLNGTLSPLKNRTPEKIGIEKLKQRVMNDSVSEIILALPTDLEGETTALYIASIYKQDEKVHVTKLANGIPIGTNLEYLDTLTISSSIKGRISLNTEDKNNEK